MVEDTDREIAQRAAALKAGSIVAAAGCGKTEQIANATLLSGGRRLILTHTHAGVDVLRARLKKLNVPGHKFRLDTIAGWCLRYAIAFPARSGLSNASPETDAEWNAVYEAATALLSSSAVDPVLKASYLGVFVDEYQDCSVPQHAVVKALAKVLPVCVFGDPLQAIFDFKGQKPVDWPTDVFPSFPKSGELLTPWRWNNKKNTDLAEWLDKVRAALEGVGPLDLAGCPPCVKWEVLPTDPNFRSAKIVEVSKRVRGDAGEDTVVVIGDAASIGVQANIARKLAKAGFSKIEPVDCKTLYAAAKKLAKTEGFEQLEVMLAFISDCMIGVGEKPFRAAVDARKNGRKQGAAKYGSLIDVGLALVNHPTDRARLALLEGFYGRDECYCYRREMYFAMRAALQICVGRPGHLLKDAITDVQRRARHAGRTVARRCVGSTLLVKGLEFDHAVVVHTPKMSRKDWYVALTRSSKSLTLLVPAEKFTPPA